MILNLIVSNKISLSTVLTVQNLKSRYLPGLPIPDSITDETLEFFINSATTEIENYLGLLVARRVYTEKRDFFKDDWQKWGYLHTTYPIVCAISLDGFLATTKQVSYPKGWLSIQTNSGNRWVTRLLHVVPTASATHSEMMVYSGVVPQVGYFGSSQIPNYWSVSYVTGWDIPPSDILDAIGMLSCVKVLQVISDALQSGTLKTSVDANGRTVLAQNGTSFNGLGFGLTSKSISIDGLSQSYSSYVNGQTGIWGARLKQYTDLLNPSQPGSLLSRLYDQYAAIVMGVA